MNKIDAVFAELVNMYSFVNGKVMRIPAVDAWGDVDSKWLEIPDDSAAWVARIGYSYVCS